MTSRRGFAGIEALGSLYGLDNATKFPSISIAAHVEWLNTEPMGSTARLLVCIGLFGIVINVFR